MCEAGGVAVGEEEQQQRKRETAGAVATNDVQWLAALLLLKRRKYYTCFHRKEFRRISGLAGDDSFLLCTAAMG